MMPYFFMGEKKGAAIEEGAQSTQQEGKKPKTQGQKTKQQQLIL